MDSCLKFHACSGLKEILALENKEEQILKCKTYTREYVHRLCKEKLIETVLGAIPDSISF